MTTEELQKMKDFWNNPVVTGPNSRYEDNLSLWALAARRFGNALVLEIEKLQRENSERCKNADP